MVTPPTYELQIEELVLHGWSARDARFIGIAMERELMRLLQQDGVPSMLSGGGNTGRIDGGSIRLSLNMRPAAIGVQIARSVYTGIKKRSVSMPASAPLAATPAAGGRQPAKIK